MILEAGHERDRFIANRRNQIIGKAIVAWGVAMLANERRRRTERRPAYVGRCECAACTSTGMTWPQYQF